MKTQFDIRKFIEQGSFKNELDFERALIAYRKLRLLEKDNGKLKIVRSKLGNLIEEYENRVWVDKPEISDKKLRQSDIAEIISEQERLFINHRKKLIKEKLREVGLNQQELGFILGHISKSYMSELINGIRSFTIKDIVIINRLLKISLNSLIPVFLPQDDCEKIKDSIEKLDNPQIKLCKEDLILA